MAVINTATNVKIRNMKAGDIDGILEIDSKIITGKSLL